MMRTGHRFLAVASCFTVAASMASGYYHWTYFAGRSAPFNPITAKFDISALPNSTVSYFISDQQPAPLMPGDSYTAVVSQIRSAADVWNHVPSSALRVTFGGISTVGAIAQSTPGIDVVFDDNMPPGLLAQTRLSTPDDLSLVANGAPFVPILRSRVQLRRDLTAGNGQFSGSDLFFLTAVHELGHALGLQHTLTSGVMSTAVTRATTKAAPLAADDIVGVSLLYPGAGFLAATGSISGSVLLVGAGVNLASVVAISANGVAVSGMTNPDGTYRIRGIPPGQYYVYAHPLPPPMNGEASPANIIPPVDSQKNPFPATTGFDTQFFPGTRDWTQAAVVAVGAGNSADGVNFNMQRRSAVAIPFALTYAYQGQVPVPSPPILGGGPAVTVAFYAPGATANAALSAGLNVSAIGPAPARVRPGTLTYWAGSNGYTYFAVDAGAVSAATPVALAISLPNELYVLPAAFSVVPGAPPSISSVSSTGSSTSQGQPIVSVAGSNLVPGTRIVFDGSAGTILSTNSDGSLSVAAPPASGGYTATVEALTADGQTSQQGLGSNPSPVFVYPAGSNPSISVGQGNLLPGTDAMVEIDGAGTDFFDGCVAAGFGSSDIVVQRVWVTGTGRVLMNIFVGQQAQPGSVEVTATCGLQLATLTTVMQVQAANPRQITMHAPVLNQATGLAGTPAGGTALVVVSGAPANIAVGWTVTVGGLKAGSVSGSNGQIVFQVPNGVPVGPAAVQLTTPNGDQIPPLLMQIDPPPPVIVAAVNSIGVPIDQAHPVKQGDPVLLTVTGLLDSSGNPPAPGSIRINVSSITGTGMDHTPSAVLSSSIPGAVQLPFVLNPNVPYGPQQILTVGIDTRVSSQTFTIAIRPQQ
jgi:hypothetical protein